MAATQNNSAKLSLNHPSHSTGIARNKFVFTRGRIDALPLPSNGQRAYYYDAKVRGLAVAVSPLGKKTFILYRWLLGRPERITIGPYVDLTIDQARKRAEQLNGDIALGKNPAEERRKIRDESTLTELFETFLEQYARPHKKTWRDDVGTFNLHLHSWRLRKISSIRKADVIALHNRIGRNRGKYIANRVVELLCSMFNRAREDFGWEGENPAAGIKAFREKKRDRFLDGNELPAFFESLAKEFNECIRDYILISLLTGGRRSNVESMRWSEISWERAKWTVPPEKSKSGEPLDIALSGVALRILENRRAASIGEWVFPGRGRSGHLVEPKSAWKRIIRRAGISDLRIHDLRRTLGSWAAATGASLPVIGRSLGHKSLAATQVYARLNLDPVRVAVQNANDAMLLAGGLKPAGLLEGK